jgi:glutamate racemase
MSNKPIGVFDSGVGGLTVLKRLTDELPDENYIYFGDTARVPYGEKTKEQLFDMVREILDWFKIQNIKAAVMACNTSSAVVLEEIKDEYDFPVFGMIMPTAEYVAYSNSKKVGLIATTATANSHAYSKAIKKINSEIEVIETACPGLVEIVESNKIETFEAKNLVIKYITPLLEKNVEKIILGCTHYPYLKGIITYVASQRDMLIDPAEHLVRKVEQDLMNSNLLNEDMKSEKTRQFFVSSNAPMFTEAGKNFYPALKDVQEINIAETLNNLIIS